MSKRWCLPIFMAAGAGMAMAAAGGGRVSADATATTTPPTIPTVTISNATPVSVPTVALPQPTATATAVPPATPLPPRHKRSKHHRHARRHTTTPHRTWIDAYLTSYCPGSAGWLSSSGLPVYYGMLANNYYRFGTRVYIPVIGITGVVEDHMSSYAAWYQFDVWSAVCYSTPTGYYPVAIEG